MELLESSVDSGIICGSSVDSGIIPLSDHDHLCCAVALFFIFMPNQRWYVPLTVQSSGSPLKVLKQSANNFFSGDVIPGATGSSSLLAEDFCFVQSFKI